MLRAPEIGASYATVVLLIGAVLGNGCVRAVDRPVCQSITSLQEHLTFQVANRMGHAMGVAFMNALEERRTGTRRGAFYQLTRLLDQRGGVSGACCIELLGMPDYWKVHGDGSTALLYKFKLSSQRGESVCFVNIEPNGMFRDTGYNSAKSVDYATFVKLSEAKR